MNHTVIGFIKSGQQAMVQYCKDTFNEKYVGRLEVLWRKDAVDVIEKHVHDYPGVKLIIMTRDPVMRIWSQYFYWKHDEKMSLNEYLLMDGYDDWIGELNPIKQSNYAKYIEPVLKFNPIIVRLEDMMQNPNFVPVNVTKNDPNKNWLDIENPIINEIRIALEDNGIDWRFW